MSAFRFVASSRRGSYSVWRGDQPIGYVAKATLHVGGYTRDHATGNVTYTKVTRTCWIPSTTERKDLASEPTREAAAAALWRHRT